MNSINAIALFCEDVRQEVGGTVTLIGLLSDNLAVPAFPGAMPKLAVYARVHVPVDQKPKAMRFFLCDGDSKNEIGGFDEDFVSRTISETKAMDNSLAGFVLTVMASPYPISKESRHWVEMHWGTDTAVIGTLKFVLQTATTP
jgi:hypothetical protein